MLHLVRKAFFPSTLPFLLLHVDTRWKFCEMHQFQDHTEQEYSFELMVHKKPEMGSDEY